MFFVNALMQRVKNEKRFDEEFYDSISKNPWILRHPSFVPFHYAYYYLKEDELFKNVKRLLEYDINLNKTPAYLNNGETVLHLAVKHDTPIEIIEQLIRKGANINIKDAYGETPLFKCRKFEVVKHLISLGADFNLRSTNGNTFIDCTYSMDKCLNEYLRYVFDIAPDVRINNIERCMFLSLEKDVADRVLDRVNLFNFAGYDHLPPIMNIVLDGSLHVLEEVLKRGADPNVVFYVSRDVLRKYGIDYNARLVYETPMSLAIRCHSLDAAKILFEYGANVLGNGNSEFSPLYLAIMYEHDDLLDLFLESMTENDVAEFLFDNIMFRCRFRTIEHTLGFAKVIGKLTHNPHRNGQTLLHYAAMHGVIPIIEKLLPFGAKDVNEFGDTILHVARGLNVIKLILPYVQRDAVNLALETPLHQSHFTVDELMYLYKMGFSILAEDIFGQTPAVHRSHPFEKFVGYHVFAECTFYGKHVSDDVLTHISMYARPSLSSLSSLY